MPLAFLPPCPVLTGRWYGTTRLWQYLLQGHSDNLFQPVHTPGFQLQIARFGLTFVKKAG